MPLHALDNLASTSASGIPGSAALSINPGPAVDPLRWNKAEESPTFRQALALKSSSAAPATDLPHQRVAAYKAAKQFVSTAFIQPLLAQLRNDPLKSSLFHGGFAEDAFQSRLDTILADRVVDRMSTHTPVLDAPADNKNKPSPDPSLDPDLDAPAPGKTGGLSLVDTVYHRIIAPAERRAALRDNAYGKTRNQPAKVSLHG